jgi:hypothetical protein
MTWTCPECLRTFATSGQFHSHDVVEIEAHFAGRPAALRATFDALVTSLANDMRVEPLKSVIILASRTTFGYVIVHRDRLRVGIFLDCPLDVPRVSSVEQLSAGKVGNVVELRTPSTRSRRTRVSNSANRFIRIEGGWWAGVPRRKALSAVEQESATDRVPDRLQLEELRDLPGTLVL